MLPADRFELSDVATEEPSARPPNEPVDDDDRIRLDRPAHPGAPWTVVLTGTSADSELLGGKGAALDRLIGAGMPVPSTGAITTAAYAALCGDEAIRALLGRARRGEPPTDEAVDDAFLCAALPEAIEAEITRLARRIGGSGRLAIRSSATTEDAASFSFAGQYRSVLDVDPADEAAVLRAVRLVFASLWHHAPVNYRRIVGLSADAPAMAAILMRMVPARYAGVVFTIDPTGSAQDRGAARVEVVAGAGEALVSGRTTPRVFRLRRDGGHDCVENDPAPPDHVVGALELALQVESDAGTAQDVEWVWDGERLWIVQARPITTLTVSRDELDEWDELTALVDTELTTAGIDEMLPGVLPPLVWDLCSFLVDEAFRRMFAGLGVLPAELVDAGGLLHRVRGRAALDYSRLASMAGRLPDRAAQTMESQYFAPGRPSTALARPVRERRWRRLAHDLQVSRLRSRAIVDADVSIGVARRLIGARERSEAGTTAQPPGGASIPSALLRLLDAAARAMGAELIVAADAAAAYGRLERMLRRRLNDDEAARQAGLLTASATPPAVPVGASAAVFAGPTWQELGAEPAMITRQSHGDVMAAVIRALAEHSRWNDTSWRSRLYLRSLRRLADEAVEQLSRRESTKAAVLVLGGEVRRLLQRGGDELVRAGLLAVRDDVELLRLEEFLDAMHGGAGPLPSLLRRRRRRLLQAEADGPLPLRFTGEPCAEPVALSGDLHQLRGAAASSGQHRGRARVITAPTDTLGTNEVLVAHATDPSWSPLLARAGAIVVERGGPLSHAAILARELGVPAVLDVAGAVAILDGRMVVVDGDRGVVTVIEEA